MLLFGAVASISDTLMRLIYQKYKATELDMAEKGIVEIEPDVRKDPNKAGTLRMKIEQDLGIGGILPVIILLGTIFHMSDLVVFYMFTYYGISCMAVTGLYIRKAILAAKTER